MCREAEIERRIGNLTRALADGYSPAITADLARFEGQLSEIREKLSASLTGAVAVQMSNTRRFVETRLAGLRALLHAEPAVIRAEIAKHVQKITLTPEGRVYVATGTWDLLGFGSCSGAGGAAQTDRYFPFTLKVAA